MERSRSEVDADPGTNGIGPPVGGNRLHRMVQHTQALTEDITDWVELRIQLLKLEIEEDVEKRANKLIVQAMVGALAGLGAFFLLVTIALALGEWLGHPGWGFAVVTLLLFAAAGVVFWIKPEFVERPLKLRSNNVNPNNRSAS